MFLLFKILFFFSIINILIIFFYPLILFFLKYKKSKDIPSNKKFSIAIIIPFYNEKIELQKKINSIIIPENTYSNFEIIVINDGNKNYKFNKLILNSNYNFKIIKLSKQYGKCFAQYFASLKTNYDYLLLTDSNSIFDKNYFFILNNYLGYYEIFGGVLIYKNSLTEKEIKYWKVENKLKILENDKDFWNTGLFGSNIIIKASLFRKFPYYNLCDFSLPLFYQMKTNNKIKIIKKLIVYEKSNNKISEIFKVKKRIVHRALFGLYKTLKTTKKNNSIFLFQLYCHKISRWFILLWIIIIILYNIIVWNNYLLLILFCLMCIYKPYILVVSTASLSGIISFILNKKLNKWIPSEK